MYVLSIIIKYDIAMWNLRFVVSDNNIPRIGEGLVVTHADRIITNLSVHSVSHFVAYDGGPEVISYVTDKNIVQSLSLIDELRKCSNDKFSFIGVTSEYEPPQWFKLFRKVDEICDFGLTALKYDVAVYTTVASEILKFCDIDASTDELSELLLGNVTEYNVPYCQIFATWFQNAISADDATKCSVPLKIISHLVIAIKSSLDSIGIESEKRPKILAS